MSEAAAGASPAGGQGAAGPSGAGAAAASAAPGGEAAITAPAGGGKGANPPPPGGAAAVARPEWVEEKHWDAAKGVVKTEDLGKAYKEAVGKLSTRKDDLLAQAKAERQAGRPEKPDGYALDLPATFKPPAGVNIKFGSADPAIDHMRELAHAEGWSQAEFSTSLQKYAERLIARVPSEKQELAALGERAGDRIKAVRLWGEKVLGKNDFQLLIGRNPTAKHVEAFERLMNVGKDPRLANGGAPPPANDKPKTLAELRQMQLDPRYADPGKRDKTFVAQVDAEYQRAYSGKRQTAPLGPRRA
jgi:hypothetical protein